MIIYDLCQGLILQIIKQKRNYFLINSILYLFLDSRFFVDMFFIISKVFSFFLSPFIWAFVLLLLAFFTRKKKIGKLFLTASIVVFFFFSNRFISESALRLWEVKTPQLNQISKTYDIGIVLGGGLVAYDEQNDQLVYGQSSDRILQAIDMYNAKRVKKILISGGSGSLLKNNDSEAVLMKKFLINIGIEKNDILIDSLSRNTNENAIETKRVLTKNNIKGDYILFTSAIHMRRASACFEKQSMKCDIYSTNNTFREKERKLNYFLTPSSLAFYQWDAILHEITGMITYKYMGYI